MHSEWNFSWVQHFGTSLSIQLIKPNLILALIPYSSIIYFVWLKHVLYSGRIKSEACDLHTAAHNVSAALREPTVTCSPAGQHMKWHPNCVTLYYHLSICLYLIPCPISLSVAEHYHLNWSSGWFAYFAQLQYIYTAMDKMKRSWRSYNS